MTTSEILPEFPRSDFSWDLFNFRAAGGARDHCKSGTNKDACFDL